jgi:hypothetical protein
MNENSLHVEFLLTEMELVPVNNIFDHLKTPCAEYLMVPPFKPP